MGSGSHVLLIAEQGDSRLPNYAALPGDNDAKSAAALRTANDSISRVTPLMIRLTPTNVPIAQLELE